jgi:hypothetical protein
VEKWSLDAYFLPILLVPEWSLTNEPILDLLSGATEGIDNPLVVDQEKNANNP